MVSPALQRALAAAREAWPEVEVPEDAFASYVQARCDSADLAALHLSDLYLACACSRGDPRAVATFDRVVLAPVETIARDVPGAEHLAADVAQLVRTRLLAAEFGRRRIDDYRGTGALSAWVRVITLRLASNVRRAERARSGTEALPAPAPPALDDALLRERYGAAFNEAFRRSFRALGAEDRLVLRLHYADGLSFDQIAAALDFSRATAGRRLLAARTLLREETLRILGEELKATREELESVLDAIRSHLDVSLGALVTAA